MNPEDGHRQRFDALIDVIRESDTFYMPSMTHDCGTPACIAGHCEAHFGEELYDYLDISAEQECWLVYGHFFKKDWEHITKEDAITALEMVYDGKVPDDLFELDAFTID